jgi:3-hydroxyisobutyrate dehydrogenase-like beta-hydroxyacid dehydrogenase
MTTVTVLGLGPMGQALSKALLDADYPITVWNRTESKADALRARGAVWASSPAEAVAASELTLVNVIDHDAVDEVLALAGDAMGGRVIVGLTSDTATGPGRLRSSSTIAVAGTSTAPS